MIVGIFIGTGFGVVGVQRMVEADDVGLVQAVTLERIDQYPVNLREIVIRESAASGRCGGGVGTVLGM